MKKHMLLIAIVGLLGLTAVMLLFLSPEQPSDSDKSAKNSPAATYAAAPDKSPTSAATPDADSETTTREDLPAPSAADLSEAVFAPTDEGERKFLTPDQLEELAAASVVKHDPEPRVEQQLNVTWKEGDLAAKLPELPASAPVYLLDRPTDMRIFNVLKTLAESLGIKGSVVRMDPQNYAVANITTGDYYLFYDLFHLTFDAEGLAYKLAEAGVAGVEKALTDMGLLGFERTVTEETDAETGAKWIRFTPKLPLPVVSLDRPTDLTGFTPGKAGTVDVRVEGDTIVQIDNSFPNVAKKDTATIAGKEDLLARIKEGAFRLGDVQLQYPGALALEDKRRFFELASEEKLAIADAELARLECGYLLENEESVQALLAPVCIAHGKGKVDAYSVLFRVVISAAK